MGPSLKPRRMIILSRFSRAVFAIFEDFYDLVALENFFQRDDS